MPTGQCFRQGSNGLSDAKRLLSVLSCFGAAVPETRFQLFFRNIPEARRLRRISEIETACPAVVLGEQGTQAANRHGTIDEETRGFVGVKPVRQIINDGTVGFQKQRQKAFLPFLGQLRLTPKPQRVPWLR